MTHGLNNHPRSREERAALWRAWKIALVAGAVVIVVVTIFHALV